MYIRMCVLLSFRYIFHKSSPLLLIEIGNLKTRARPSNLPLHSMMYYWGTLYPAVLYTTLRVFVLQYQRRSSSAVPLPPIYQQPHCLRAAYTVNRRSMAAILFGREREKKAK
jgi:hypothetical protein